MSQCAIKNNSLQVSEKWNFTLAKTSEMYKTKSKKWLRNLYPTQLYGNPLSNMELFMC